MNPDTAMLIRIHNDKIALLRAAGQDREADALEAALRNYVEQQEREHGRNRI